MLLVNGSGSGRLDIVVHYICYLHVVIHTHTRSRCYTVENENGEIKKKKKQKKNQITKIAFNNGWWTRNIYYSILLCICASYCFYYWLLLLMPLPFYPYAWCVCVCVCSAHRKTFRLFVVDFAFVLLHFSANFSFRIFLATHLPHTLSLCVFGLPPPVASSSPLIHINAKEKASAFAVHRQALCKWVFAFCTFHFY